MNKAIAVVLAFVTHQATLGTPFRPWGIAQYRIVNAVEFMPDGKTMLVALFPSDVAKVQGLAMPAAAPEVALYESRREGNAWLPPRLLPFAGQHKDYEAAVAPDGSFVIFNSQRPLPDGTSVPTGKNNLWLARRTETGWTAPVYLRGINRLATEESYASITADGHVVYLHEGAADEHGADWNIHIGRVEGNDVVGSRPFGPASTLAGEGDPWIAPDGSYVIFTRWDRAKKWEEDADLYIAFRRDDEWSSPLPLGELNVAGAPDYALSIAGTPATVYWKSRGQTLHAPWEPVIAAARARSRRSSQSIAARLPA